MAGDALYIDIYKKLLQDIRSGKYPENTPLPSEESLCGTYNVSRTTLRRALALLKQADMVYSVQGNGAYIKPRVYTQPLSEFYSFTDTLKSDNVLIQNKIIRCEVIRADQSLAAATGYPVGTSFHKLVRLRSAREYPLMLENTYLPQSRFLSLDVDVLAHSSLYDFLKTHYGFHVERATERFRPVMPRADERALLQISANTPCILLERFSYEKDVLSEYTKSIVRGDKYTFQIEFQIAQTEPASD